MPEIDTTVAVVGLMIVGLTNFALFVSKFSKHQTRLDNIESRLDEHHKSYVKLQENSKTLHNIEGKLEIMIELYSNIQKK